MQLYFLPTVSLLILLAIFFTYFNQKKEVKIKELTNKKYSEITEEKSNIINDINYSSKDNIGNAYNISAEIGKINNKNEDMILLENVIAKITIVDSEDIIIYSNFAEYNSKNYDTKFYDNTKVIYASHKIKCEYLDLLFNKNLATLYGNIVYESLSTKLLADRLEIDLITKNSKLSMKNEKEKIEVIYIK